MTSPPSIADFGHKSIMVGGKQAYGGRKLLVVLVNYSGEPPISTAHSAEYYELLAFGNPTPPFSTDNPVNPGSLSEYFRENSHGRFWFDPVGVIGPLDMELTDPEQVPRCTAIMEKVAEVSPQSLVSSDADSSHFVGQNEMSVLLVENFFSAKPDTSGHNQVVANVGTGSTAVSVIVSTVIAGGGPLTPFYQFGHELSHAALETKDMYYNGKGNYGMTLMSGHPFTANDQYTVHLDIWHKFALGWAEPRVHRLYYPGSAEIWEGPDSALLLWDETRGANEYFLVERRRPNAPGQRYDSGFTGDGAVIWRVQKDVAGGVVTLAPPDLARGGSGPWKAGTQTPHLTWANGEPTNAAIAISDAGEGRLRVRWGEEPELIGPSRHHMLFHGGNGTDGAGGLPRQGIFYGITANRDLEWNRYSGHGAQIGDPGADQSWHANSGNLIGWDFGQMLHVVGCGNGVIMAVHKNGDLYWYSYSGGGESGDSGWHANSGHVIGNGWQNFRHVVAIPPSPTSGSLIQVLAIDAEGAVRWYGYEGNGETDRSGHKGWELQKSGNQIDSGWGDLRHVHASGRVIFTIDQDGFLRWYRYEGVGEEDLTGAQNWHPNYGKAVGKSWQGMQNVFGGESDVGGYAHIIMGVDADGFLRWYRYTGQGEEDATGSIAWDDRSGNRIGARW